LSEDEPQVNHQLQRKPLTMFTARKIILLLSVALVASLDLQVQASSAIEQAPDISALSRRVAEIDDIATTDHLDDGDHDDEGHEDEDHDDHDDHDDEGHEDEDHEEHAEHDDKPWSEVIIASLLVNLVTLSGLAVLSGEFLLKSFCKSSRKEGAESRWKFTQNIIPSFACGALLATCAFLILPESLAMISSFFDGDDSHSDHRALEEEDHEEHEDTDALVAWRFGTSLLGGFLLPSFASFLFPRYYEPEVCEACLEAKNEETIQHTNIELDKDIDLAEDSSASKNKAKEDDSSAGPITMGEFSHEEAGSVDKVTVTVDDKNLEPSSAPINYSLAASILIGDFFHNFTDGILIGTAFLLCDRELAIAISAATVYHELAQELADYFLLTKHCNIRPGVALLLNFIGGFSVLFGAVLILSANVSSNATGCILAIGGGVYIYVATVETLPRARDAQKDALDKLIAVISFVVGVVPIGLVLLNHGHCEG
jgi:zinc transporter ZupT